MTPLGIITNAIRFDHRPTENARRIIADLALQGYRITNQPVSTLPETARTYAEPTGRTTTTEWPW